MKIEFLTLGLCAAMLTSAPAGAQVTWTATTSPVQTTLAGGPWLLPQGGPYVETAGTTTSGGPFNGTTPYCTPGGAVSAASGGTPIVNPSTTVNTMQPFYFPFVAGRGTSLQGYFDYRPRNVNEAIVAATSADGGLTWHFQQQIENLTTYCPATNSNGGTGNDDGLGHPFVVSFGGAGWLYQLNREGGHVDSDGLMVHTLAPKAGAPLNGLPVNTELGPPPVAGTITRWDFSQYPMTANTTAINPAPSIGSGSAIPLGMTNGYPYVFTNGTTFHGSVDGEDVTQTPAATDPNPNANSWRVRGTDGKNGGNNKGNGWSISAPEYTQGVQFNVSTAGHKYIVFQYDWYTTAQGVRNLQAQYTIDGTHWINVGPVQVAPAGGGYFDQITINFHALGITTVENNANFGMRLVSVYDRSPTAPTPYTYTAATPGVNGAPVQIDNNSGNWRFDEINVLGTVSGAAPYTAPVSTVGLTNPDGILASVPNVYPLKVLYVDKTLNGDFSFPPGQQCGPTPSGAAANHDTETIHLATSADGIHFTDLGAVNGLNDPTTTSYHSIRYMAPNGSLVKLSGGKWGLFFGGGNCVDGDSDGFHAIMYAESSDLVNWNVINGIDNPIASVSSIPDPNNSSATIPATLPVAGATQPWFGGRVYNPQAMWGSSNTINLIFSGYDAAYSADISNYRTIGHVTLSSGSTVLP
jgi:hypothetical protein